MANSKHFTGKYFQPLRIDRAGKDKSQTKSTLERLEGSRIDYAPPYAVESNKKAERLVQELILESMVFLSSSYLPLQLWAEGMHHGN